MMESYPSEASNKLGAITRRPNITLRQNLDDQIVAAEKHVEALKAAKARMESSGILDTRIEDIQAAMRW